MATEMKHPCFMGCDAKPSDRFYVSALAEFTVYAHTVDDWTKTHYAEDWPHTVALRESGERDFVCAHSVVTPDGELGAWWIPDSRESTFEEFMLADEQGWPPLAELTTARPAISILVPDEDGHMKEVWNSIDGDKE